MKSILLSLILAVPLISFAAPSGHQICRDVNQKFEFTVGTYASLGEDGTLKTGGREFVVSAQSGEGFGELTSKLEVFCLCEPPKGPKVATVKWDVTSGDLNDPTTLHMTIKRDVEGKQKVTEIDMNCAVLDYKSGNEQN